MKYLQGESEFQQLFPGGNEYDLKKVDLKLHEAPYAVHNNRCVIWNQYYWSFDQISPFIAKPPDDDAMGKWGGPPTGEKGSPLGELYIIAKLYIIDTLSRRERS